MDSARLRPHHSRENSQGVDYASDYQSSDDGYDYNVVDQAPEAQPTKAKKSAPPKFARTPTVVVASKGHEDADHAFAETMPHIWQRHAGGRRAKIPAIELDLEKGASDAVTIDEKEAQSKLWPKLTSIKLRWTMSENQGKRVLQLVSGTPDVEIQKPYLQRRRVRWQ